MSGRSWLVVILIAVAVLAGFWYVMKPDSGDVEFQRAQEALKKVHGWKLVALPPEEASSAEGMYRRGEWEVDCATAKRPEPPQWGSPNYFSPEPDFASACSALRQGKSAYPFPNFKSLVEKSVIADKGTTEVNGVKCRKWQVQVVKFTQREDFTVCLGTKDHLPYEISGAYEPHLMFSDYQIEAED